MTYRTTSYGTGMLKFDGYKPFPVPNTLVFYDDILISSLVYKEQAQEVINTHKSRKVEECKSLNAKTQ